MKITEMRLLALLGQSAGESELHQRTLRRADQVLNQLAVAHTSTPLRSPITTHVLDSAMGVPARGLPLALMKRDDRSLLWDTVSGGVTNEDGRVGGLLPPSNYLQPGR
jgi:5-hydroxyisourate hydrolase/2-oxo-4-hydroxy-4-carboxy-5-ureidoimidazoline decarboxylase